MKRSLLIAGLLLSSTSAFGAAFTQAGWYRIEVYPSLEILAGPLASEAACLKTISPKEDDVHRCVKLTKAGDEVDRAIEYFGDEAKTNPRNSTAMCLRGLLFQRKRDMEAARTEFERAMKANPDDFWPYVFRADLYNEMGKAELAIADYRQVLERNPGDASLVATLEEKLRKLGAAP
jgi:tetratricopeptide (TPR) repeat protein